MEIDRQRAFNLLQAVLTDPHRSLQDKRRFLEFTNTAPDSLFFALSGNNDAIWWMRVLGHGSSHGITPLNLPLHHCARAGLLAPPGQAELTDEQVPWADHISRHVSNAPETSRVDGIGQSALPPQALLTILDRVSSQLPHLSAGADLPAEVDRWLQLVRLALDHAAAAGSDVSKVAEHAFAVLNTAWARCAGTPSEHARDTVASSARQAWAEAFIETALHEWLLAQNLRPAIRRCLWAIAAWGDGGGPTAVQVLKWLPQALGRTRCKAMAEMLVVLFIPWIRVRTPTSPLALARLDTDSFLRSALRHGHQQAQAHPQGGWDDWPQWLNDLCSPIESSFQELSEEARRSVSVRSVGCKSPRADTGARTVPVTGRDLKRTRTRTRETRASAFDAEAYGERLRRWLNGTDPKPPRPPDGANVWWVLNEAWQQLPSPDRLGGDEWQDALAAVRRWSGLFFRKLQTLPRRKAVPDLALTLLDDLWQRRLAPAREAMEKRTGIPAPWPSLTKDHLVLALHPAVLHGAPQAALVRCIGTWAPQMSLDPDTAMEFLEQAMQALHAQADRLSLVKALLPFTRTWKQADAPSWRIRALLMILLNSEVCGADAGRWIAELRPLFTPMHLEAEDALAVLMRCASPQDPSVMAVLAAWLWPFVDGPARKVGDEHPGWAWLMRHPAAMKSLHRLPEPKALESLQILAAQDRPWHRPGPFETAWCALFSHLRRGVDASPSGPLQQGLQAMRPLYELHPVVQANAPDHLLDDIDWAIWEGLRGQELREVALRTFSTVKGQIDLPQARQRLEDRKHLVAPDRLDAPPSRQTMAQLLGPDLADELLRGLNETLLGPAPPTLPTDAPTHRVTPGTGSAVDQELQVAMDAIADAEIARMIERGVSGKPLLQDMLERCAAGGVSAAQMQRWAFDDTRYLAPESAITTVRKILGEYYHDILVNVVLET
jgi:hypothetical protein